MKTSLQHSRIETGIRRAYGDWAQPASRGGFTLIELMTVMVIIVILTTLLCSVMVKVKQRANEIKCTNNLKQVITSTIIYLDDNKDIPPPNIVHLYRKGYIPMSAVMDCPNDRFGNWGEMVSSGKPVEYMASLPPGFSASVADTSSRNEYAALPAYPDYSYLQAFHMRRRTWDALMLNGRPGAGVFACQLHGIRQTNVDQPTIYAYSGRLLRGNISGDIVRRQLFWNEDDRARIAPGRAFLEADLTAAQIDQTLWRFFSDGPIPSHSMLPRKTDSGFFTNLQGQGSNFFGSF